MELVYRRIRPDAVNSTRVVYANDESATIQYGQFRQEKRQQTLRIGQKLKIIRRMVQYLC